MLIIMVVVAWPFLFVIQHKWSPQYYLDLEESNNYYTDNFGARILPSIATIEKDFQYQFLEL